MSGLRRRALDPNGKTVSRKAQSKASSASSSRVNSRPGSRVASRANTDDEGDLSDDTTFSFGSMAGELDSLAEFEAPGASWEDELGDVIVSIGDRKKSSFEGREQAFIKYSRILAACYAREQITGKKSEIIDSCLKSIKSGRTEKESLEAIRALALTIITDPDDEIYDKVTPTFKRVIADHENMLVKKNTIHTLGAAAFYGGATVAEVEGIMGFLLEIVESDGHSAGAGDDAGVVTAALEEWGFLCTQLDDAEDITMESIDALVDQLESSEVSVQVAAGENIALLYEKSYTEAEDDELDHPEQSKMIQRYQPYPRVDSLIDTLHGLTAGSKKYLNKRNKKTQKSAFTDILRTVEDPTKGPGFKESLDKHGAVRGARLTVRVHRSGVLRVDKWWKLLRLQHLRRILTAGFLTHWTENPVIFESLDLLMENV